MRIIPLIKNFLLLMLTIPLSHAVKSQLYIATGTVLKLSGDIKITLKDIDLINEGNLSNSNNSRFIFSGIDNNEISGNQVSSFSELEIAKTGNGLLTLLSDIEVSGKVVFTSNLIDLNQHNIDLGATGILESENESSYITSSGGGLVISSATLNAPSSANPGNLGAVITSSQNFGNTVIKRGHQSQVNSHGTGSSILRYYDIVPTNNSNLNATLRIHYLDAETNGLDENSFELFKSDDNFHWTDLGASSRDVSQNYAEQSGINSFSRWTLSNTSAALPVTGLTLSGNWENDMARLQWITLTEFNNSHFNIERKYSDDLDFLIIGRKNSAHPGGNSNSPTTYNWFDNPLTNKGPVQYRIQQQSLDGTSAYSNIISIRPEISSMFIQKIYPTLGVRDKVYLQTGGLQIQKMQVQLFDLSGRLMLNKVINYQSGWLALPELAPGTYKVFIRSGDYRWHGSIVKE